MIRGVLLDVDGTLVDSNEANTQAWVAAFADYGHTVSADSVRSLIGMGGDQLIPRVAPGLSSETDPGKSITSRRSEILKEQWFPKLQPTPGARALVQRIRDEGLEIVIASSAKSAELDVLLRIAHVEDLIERKTTADDAPSSKPAPDIVQAAMQQIGMSASEVCMIGDAPYDIESAGNADVGVIALRCGGFPDSAFKGALAVYDDPADLVEHYESSPLKKLSES